MIRLAPFFAESTAWSRSRRAQANSVARMPSPATMSSSPGPGVTSSTRPAAVMTTPTMSTPSRQPLFATNFNVSATVMGSACREPMVATPSAAVERPGLGSLGP